MYIRSDGLSVNQWATRKKVCYQTIYMAIKRGLSPDEACAYALKRRGHKDNHARYFVGKKSLKNYCETKGINYRSVCRKIRAGMSINLAIKRSIKK